MNSKNIKPIKKEDIQCTCMKCLQKNGNINKIQIGELGYGSKFDGISTEIYLCDDCYRESDEKIWDLEIIKDDFMEEYKNEDKMIEYINQLPIQSQELIYNTLATGWGADYVMDQQDWIDYELKELPHEKCKDYGLYSPQEIKAYQEQYPNCEYVFNTIWDDNSKGSHCSMHSCTSGGYGATTDRNYSQDCYQCEYFKQRETPIKDIKGEDMDDYETYIKSKVHSDLYKKKFE